MVSIVMTTYNGEKYIVEQLDSIRNQTLQPDEVLIFDDRSSDKTYQIIVEYIEKYSLKNWKVSLNQENKGYSLNFTDALASVSGDIIFLADQDDIWFPEKVAEMCKEMEKNASILLLASNVIPFYEGKNPQEVNFEKIESYQNVIQISDKRKWIKPIRPGCSMCFRKELMTNYRKVWFNKYPHDCLLWGLAVFQNVAFLYNKDTMSFRRHDNNASSRGMHSKHYRLAMIRNETDIMNRMLSYQREEGNVENVKLLEKQILLYKKRINYLEKRNLLGVLGLLPRINYFGRKRFWLTDMYYCIK